MKLRPAILVILLFLIPSVEAQEDLYQLVKEYQKPYLVVAEVIKYFSENHALSWSFFQGNVSIEHSVQKQESNLRLARSKLKDFDHLLKLYSGLKVVSKAGVKHKSIMLDFFDTPADSARRQDQGLGRFGSDVLFDAQQAAFECGRVRQLSVAQMLAETIRRISFTKWLSYRISVNVCVR